MTRLADKSAAGALPTASSQADPGACGIRNSHPFSSDSIQQVSGGEVSFSFTAIADAIREPKECSSAGAGSGREAKTVQFGAESERGRLGNNSLSRLASETTTAEWSRARGVEFDPH